LAARPTDRNHTESALHEHAARGGSARAASNLDVDSDGSTGAMVPQNFSSEPRRDQPSVGWRWPRWVPLVTAGFNMVDADTQLMRAFDQRPLT